jgi:DNA-binding NarL/FixJ family response regulator
MMTTEKKIRILLADDHQIVRQGIRLLLSSDDRFEIIGETCDGVSTLEFAKRNRPDVIVMDITMPNLNGIDATRRIMDEIAGIRIVALSMYFDKYFLAMMLRAGARGYLPKDCASGELARAIEVVSLDKFYISPGLGIHSPKDVLNGSEIPNFIAVSLLTNKEREILQLIAEGNSSKEIAAQLNVHVKTVEKHRNSLIGKLGMPSVAELTKFAIREGLTSADR